MNRIRKAVFAGAVVLASGCVHTQSLDQAQAANAAATKAVVETTQPQATPVIRPMQSYGAFGGYRYRRFTGV